MMASFCFIPWEYSDISCPRLSFISNASAYLSISSPLTSSGTPNISAIKFKYPIPVMKSYISGLSGIYAICFLHSSGFSFMDTPSIRISPSSKFRIPVHAFMVVVLPAPLCPMKPYISPGIMCRLRLSTASLSPYLFVRFFICSIIFPPFSKQGTEVPDPSVPIDYRALCFFRFILPLNSSSAARPGPVIGLIHRPFNKYGVSMTNLRSSSV